MNTVIDFFKEQFQLPLQSPVVIFSLVLLIILLAPLLLKRLRIPGIIGLIGSGIIIGPSGFNLLAKSTFVDIFSTIGLLYIMFIAGLELNLYEFKANRNKSLVFGFFTFCLPLAVGLPVCYYLLDFDFLASLLISSIFATHTLVSYPVVSRLGIAKDLSVAVTVGGTILTDTAVLIVLAVILGAHQGDLDREFWIRILISLALFSAVMFMVVPRIAKWFFQELENEKHSHYIFVLTVVFLSAFLAEAASLEAIIGAFAAGLALNRLIPNSSALMNRIEFMGNSLFIPFFLVSVGMIVDMSVVLNGSKAMVVAAVMTVVAIAGKYIAATVTQWTFKLSKDQRNLIFGLSTAHAAATLAVVLVGYREGIVGDAVLNAIVIIILVSCVVASFVTERAGKSIVQSSEDSEDETLISELNMEQILVPISETTKVERLLRFAVLIKEEKSTHPLAILNVVPNTDEAEKRVAMARKQMEGFLSETTGADTNVQVMATIDYNAASGISRTVREISADIILMGWPQKEGVFDKLLKDRMESILFHTVKTLFICHLPLPIVQHKRLFVVVPPNAEYESGFPIWLNKLVKLSVELSTTIQLNCTERTHRAIEKFLENNALNIELNYNHFIDWEDFFILSRDLSDSDLLVMVSARKGHISHNSYMDKLPAKIERHFSNLNRIVIYPQ